MLTVILIIKDKLLPNMTLKLSDEREYSKNMIFDNIINYEITSNKEGKILLYVKDRNNNFIKGDPNRGARR